MVANIFLCTLLLWLLKILIIIPIASIFIGKKLVELGYDIAKIEDLNEEEKKSVQRISVQYFIITDVIVLGIIGLIAGFLVYYFIGISLEGKGWPGMIALIICSIMGVHIRG